MGTSWNKRHATTITGVNGDAIDRSGMQKAYWRRYDLWKQCFHLLTRRSDDLNRVIHKVHNHMALQCEIFFP